MVGRPIPRGGHLRILISENCPWLLDHFLLKLLSAWFYRGSKNKALALLPSIPENVLISSYLYWLLRVHLDPLINSQKERWSLDLIWSQSKTLLQVTCKWLPLVFQGMVSPICTTVTAATRHLDHPVYQGRGGVASLSSVYYWVKGQNVRVVNGHWPISSTVKQWRTFLQCCQVIKQQKRSKLIDLGLSYDYSAYGSDHTLYSIFIPL